MDFTPYADVEYYIRNYGGTTVPMEELSRRLRIASRHVDSLTYNRIVGEGFDALTPFQQEVIREVVCQQADFECENEDMIGTVLSGYSLNGASVQFGTSWNVFAQNGVAMRKDTYNLLSQTGLCCRLAR